MDRKGSVVVGILVVIIIVIAVLWIIDWGSRDCRTDTDCPQGYYCGSDFECHEHKVVQITQEIDYTTPAVILGICIVAAAWILKNGPIRFGR